MRRSSENDNKGATDPLSNYFNDLRSKDIEIRSKAAKSMRRFVESRARDLGTDEFNRLMQDITSGVFELVNSSDIVEPCSGIMVINELIEISYHDSDTMMVRFTNALKILLQEHRDPNVLQEAAAALGHLAGMGTSLAVDIVQFMVKQSLEWLQHGHRSESRRRAAVLILKELSCNAPTLFNVHVNDFLEYIWIAVHDSKQPIREGATDALRACLIDIRHRHPDWKRLCYERVFKATRDGLQQRKQSVVHGSLLVLGELLANTDDYLMSHFQSACEMVFRYRSHGSVLVRQTVVSLFPRLAKLNPALFDDIYMNSTLEMLSKSVSNDSMRDTGFVSLGELAVSMGHRIITYLPKIMPWLQKELAPKGKRKREYSQKALECIKLLARAVGVHIKPFVKNLVFEMFSGELSEPLIDALEELSVHIPDLHDDIQEQLLIAIYQVLLYHPRINMNKNNKDHKKLLNSSISKISLYGSPILLSNHSSTASPISNSSHNGNNTHINNNNNTNNNINDVQINNIKSNGRMEDISLFSLNDDNITNINIGYNLLSKKREDDIQRLQLALQTLGTFNFKGLKLLPFAQQYIVPYLYYPLENIRRAAAKTCTILTVIASEKIRYQHTQIVIFEILQRLVTVAIADPEPSIRYCILQTFQPQLDKYLAQQQLASTLFVALNDEIVAVREMAVSILGRLSTRNPAVILPSLRKTLIQLLSELKQFGADTIDLEESAKLLGHLIISARSLIRPYVRPIVDVLIPKLHESGDGVMSCILQTLGALATIGGEDLAPNLNEIIPHILITLKKKAPANSKQIALRTLGQLVESSGIVIQPYIDYNTLMQTILGCLYSTNTFEVRNEVYKVLGILGALDPHKFRQIQANTNENEQIKLLTKSQTLLPSMMNIPQDYFPSVAISALMKILREPGLTQHHNMVIKAVMFIFRSLGLGCVKYLPQTIPPFLEEMKVCEDSLRENFFIQLESLISIVKQHIRNYVGQILELVLSFWGHLHLLSPILGVVEEIATAVKEEFAEHLPRLFSCMLDVIHTDRSESRMLTRRILRALQVFSANGILESYLYVIIPEMTRVAEDVNLPIRVRKAGIRTIYHVARSHELSEYASRLIHPFARMLRQSSPKLHADVIIALCSLVYQLSSTYSKFEPIIADSIRSIKHGADDFRYQKALGLYSRLIKSPDPSLRFKTKTDFHRYMDDDLKAILNLDDDDDKANEQELTNTSGTVHNHLHVNQENLRKAWQAAKRSTPEDWIEWLRAFSNEALRESPSPALRACSALAVKYPPLASELFQAAFISCLDGLDDEYRDDLMRNLELALNGRNIPQTVVQALLNLAEFMDHNDTALPIDDTLLAIMSEKFHAYAKALHYTETKFEMDPSGTVDALIGINNRLQQQDAALGMLQFARETLNIEVKEIWFEKLHQWDSALKSYERKQLDDQLDESVMLGRMRCLYALGEWDRLILLSEKLWLNGNDIEVRKDMAAIACSTAWSLQRWDLIERYVYAIDETSDVANFFKAVLALHRKQFIEAKGFIDRCRELIDGELTALVGEGYNRAYPIVVQLQQLAELEEVITFMNDPSKQHFLKTVWNHRLQGVQHNVDVWHRLLSVRSLVMSPHQDVETWLKYVTLCRKNDRLNFSTRVLTQLLGVNPLELVESKETQLPVNQPFVAYHTLKLVWTAGYHQPAFDRLKNELLPAPIMQSQDQDIQRLKAKCYLRLGEWIVTIGNEREEAIDFDDIDNDDNNDIIDMDNDIIDTTSNNNNNRNDTDESSNHNHTNHSNNDKDNDYTSTSIDRTNAMYSNNKTDNRKSLEMPDFTRKQSLHIKQQHPVTKVRTKKPKKPGQPSIIIASLADEPTDLDTNYNASLKSQSSSSIMEAHSPSNATLLRSTSGTRRSARISLIMVPETQFDMAMPQALEAFHQATVCDPKNYKAWHAWAVMNFRVVSHHTKESKNSTVAYAHLVPAIRGFFQSIALQTRGVSSSLQDILRLLTLWFEYGSRKDVGDAFISGFSLIPVDTWLQVIPQIIARIDTPQGEIRHLVHEAVCRVGEAHPQALVYPLTVASKSPYKPRKMAALELLQNVQTHSPQLVDDVKLVSQELVRVAILWHEVWHQTIEEAFNAIYLQKNFELMMSTLLPVHEMMKKGATTKAEMQFQQVHGHALENALEWCKKYMKSRDQSDLDRANELYNSVLKKVLKQTGSMTHLDLHTVSPRLLAVKDITLAIPGTYEAGKPVITISGFDSQLKIIESKQHPRKLRMYGSNGVSFEFLLKGREDLRQDERVMQLFGLVNTMLASNRDTVRRNLAIHRYSVIPLSPNSGLIEWVPNCDTIHALIHSYREQRHILLGIEQMVIHRMSPNYQDLTVIQKVEIFEHALAATSGQDLRRVLWLKSPSAEKWLEKRTNYTRSLAVMSMVGYILGLGDRHTCNIMIDKISGKVVHIDFGDCFEVAMHRSKYPEKIPFRLTRMLINAMEVSGIEGNFRCTCESVMAMLRANKESVMAVLEAFVYDPLINWRLVEMKTQKLSNQNESKEETNNNSNIYRNKSGHEEIIDFDSTAPYGQSFRDPSNKIKEEFDENAPKEMLNERALKVINRVDHKLTGRDFYVHQVLSVSDQVQKLIQEARSNVNLCQCYIGWCPYW